MQCFVGRVEHEGVAADEVGGDDEDGGGGVAKLLEGGRVA